MVLKTWEPSLCSHDQFGVLAVTNLEFTAYDATHDVVMWRAGSRAVFGRRIGQSPDHLRQQMRAMAQWVKRSMVDIQAVLTRARGLLYGAEHRQFMKALFAVHTGSTFSTGLFSDIGLGRAFGPAGACRLDPELQSSTLALTENLMTLIVN